MGRGGSAKAHAKRLTMRTYIKFSAVGLAVALAAASYGESGSAAAEEFSAGSGQISHGSYRLSAGAVALPLWMAGALSEGSGEMIAGSGTAVSMAGVASWGAGQATRQAAGRAWDFLTHPAKERPALDTEIGRPQAHAPGADPAPGVFRGTRTE